MPVSSHILGAIQASFLSYYQIRRTITSLTHAKSIKNTTSALWIAIAITVVLIPIQTAYLLLSLQMTVPFNQYVRPAVYLSIVVVVFFFIGKDARPQKNSRISIIVAISCTTLYGVVLVLTAYLFGGANNALVPNIVAVFQNIWTIGTVWASGELIRFKLIKAAGKTDQGKVISILVSAYTYTMLTPLRGLIGTPIGDWAEFVFSSLMFALTFNIVVSLVALKGSFWSMLIVSATYYLVPIFLPILPDVRHLVWSLISCFLLYINLWLFNHFTSDISLGHLRRAKRALKYRTPATVRYFIPVMIILTATTFFIGLLPIYPIVVETNSMADTFKRGAMVIVNRIPQGEARKMIGEGEVLHFNLGQGEVLHRVVAFWDNAQGERLYVTQGDANPSADSSLVAPEEVTGIVRAVFPYIGYPNLIFRELFNLY